MDRAERWLLGSVTALFLFLTGLLYLQSTYFFSPLTFRQDNITYHWWSWYRHPMQVEVIPLGAPDGRWMTVVTHDAEIRFIIDQLKESPLLPADEAWQALSEWQTDLIYVLEFRTQTTGAVSRLGDGQRGSDLFQLQRLELGEGPTIIRLTPALRELLDQRLAEAMAP